MRLTLRTLLAYMDEILEPSDQKELEAKIETSDFAADLIHRTRDTVRRLRLSTPQVLGTGLGLDPNTVAEYLDNTLPPESVTDLERICLESDIHLAEVASCHHVLTMVLGEPAEIDPAVRQRMYSIPEEAAAGRRVSMEPAPAMAATAVDSEIIGPSAGDTPAAASGIERRKPEVPDYLRASRTSTATFVGRLVAIAAILGAVVYVASALVGSRDNQQSLADNVDANTLSPETADTESSGELSGASPDETGEANVPPSTQTEQANAEGPLDDDPSESAGPAGDVAAVDESATNLPGSEDVPMSASEVPSSPLPAVDSVPTSTPDSSEITGPAPRPVVGEGNATTGEYIPTVRLPAASGDPFSTAPTAVAPGDTLTDTTAQPDLNDVVTSTADTSTAAETEEPVAPVGPLELGTYWSESNVLLRYDADQNQWRPLANGTPLVAGDRLLTLPTFRPTLALNAGIGITLSGATLVGLDTTQETAAPRLEIVYGRAVVLNPTEEETTLTVLIGEVAGEVLLKGRARLAFDIQRQWVPGSEPEASIGKIKASAYAPDGNVEWSTAGQTVVIDKPQGWEIAAGVPAVLSASISLPNWLEEESATRLELLAAEQLRKQLQPGVSAATALLDLSEHRRQETRSLATRSSLYVGQFTPFVRALGDSDQYSAWEDHIETLRMALALNPASAARVRQALVDLRGAEAAADLYEMLQGYDLDDVGTDPEAMQRGALHRLIGWLENDSLDYRVLANHNLKQITGLNLMSNPAGNPNSRARGVRAWRNRLEDGELEPSGLPPRS